MQGIVSANSISSSVGLLAFRRPIPAAGGVCQVKGRGLSSLCSYRGAAQDDFSSRDLTSLSEIYSGLAAWSHHYWNLLAPGNPELSVATAGENHNKPSAIIDDKGHIHYSNVAFNRIADENVELRAINGIFFCRIRSSNVSSRRSSMVLPICCPAPAPICPFPCQPTCARCWSNAP